jgi:hypothetical protein
MVLISTQMQSGDKSKYEREREENIARNRERLRAFEVKFAAERLSAEFKDTEKVEVEKAARKRSPKKYEPHPDRVLRDRKLLHKPSYREAVLEKVRAPSSKSVKRSGTSQGGCSVRHCTCGCEFDQAGCVAGRVMEEISLVDEWITFLKKANFPAAHQSATATAIADQGFSISFFTGSAVQLEVQVLKGMFGSQLPAENVYCCMIALHTAITNARSSQIKYAT